jgi:hypothetical protein
MSIQSMYSDILCNSGKARANELAFVAFSKITAATVATSELA